MNTTHQLVFTGSGGQGLISAAIILGEAAVICEGLEAIQSQQNLLLLHLYAVSFYTSL